MNEKLEHICFEIITNIGIAKSKYVEAMRIAKTENDFAKANALIKKGDEVLTNGHKAHAELLKLDANGEIANIPLLAMHSEDQLMSAETIKIFAEEIISLHKIMYIKDKVLAGV